MAIFADVHPTRWKWFAFIFYKLVSLLRPEVLQTKHGFSLSIPKSDTSSYLYWLWLYGEYERNQSFIAKTFLNDGDIAVDVGANMGYFSCLFSRAVGFDGTVIAFEPESRNFASLSENIELNKISNVKLVKKGIADKSGAEKLYLVDKEFGNHSFADTQNKSTQFECVDIDTLDNILPALVDLRAKKIRLLKVDVEGLEIRVLKGAQKLIESNRIDAIIIEYSPYRIAQAGDDPAWLFEFFKGIPADIKICESSSGERAMSIKEVADRLQEFAKNQFVYFYFFIRFPHSLRDGNEC